MLTKVELFLRQEFPIDFFPLPSLLVSCSSLSLSLLCSVQHLSITSLFLASPLPFHEGAHEGLTSPDTIISRREKKSFSLFSFTLDESMFSTFYTEVYRREKKRLRLGLRELSLPQQEARHLD